MTKPTLLIHIGLPKTGTTYIQNLLFSNRDELSKQGVLYPLAGLNGTGHASLSSNYVSKKTKKEYQKHNILTRTQKPLIIRDNILYEIEQSKKTPHTIIISAESLALTDYECAAEFAQHYQPYFNTRVIAYLRRQDYLAESLRSQNYLVNFATYNSQSPFIEYNLNYNFFLCLEAWEKSFGRKAISLIEYPEKQMIGVLKSSAIKTFNLPKNLNSGAERINQRLNRDVLEYIRFHTNLIYNDGNYFRIIRRLEKYSKEYPSKKECHNFFSPQERSEIIEIHRNSNEQLSKKYHQKLFSSYPRINLNEPWKPYPGLSESQECVFDELLADLNPPKK